MRIVQWVFIIFFLAFGLWAAWQNFNTADQGDDAQDYVLALTWMPAFCEAKPGKRECKSQREGRYDTHSFSLHGLWPQPYGNFYCGVSQRNQSRDKSGNWGQLPRLDISKPLRRKLAEQMPGYQSNLHRHEWIKHGTCMEDANPNEYFKISLGLLEEINKSSLAVFWRKNIGKPITIKQINKIAENAYGAGASKRIRLNCRKDGNRQLITELHISLRGELRSSSRLTQLMRAAKPIQNACRSGIVDRVGLQ